MYDIIYETLYIWDIIFHYVWDIIYEKWYMTWYMIYRDQFGMQHEGLFSRAMQGTKVLVEKYLETMAAGLNFICDSPIADEEVSRLVGW